MGTIVRVAGHIGGQSHRLALQYAHYNDQAKPTKTENRGGPNRKSVTVTAPEPDSTKAKEKHNPEEGFKVTDWLLVLFNGMLALYTWRLYLATRGLVAAASEQSNDMKKSIAAAAEANRISAEGFHASQRAWVTEESVADSDLVWDEEGGHLTIKTTVKNIGIAPAQDVTIQVKTYAATRRSEVSIAEAMKEPTSAVVGHLLFPNSDFAPSRRLTLTYEQIDEFRNQFDPSDPARNHLRVDIAIIVRYRSTMDRKHAQTIRFYNLRMFPEDEDDISYPLLIHVDDDVPQARLLLTHYWMPSYAD